MVGEGILKNILEILSKMCFSLYKKEIWFGIWKSMKKYEKVWKLNCVISYTQFEK